MPPPPENYQILSAGREALTVGGGGGGGGDLPTTLLHETLQWGEADAYSELSNLTNGRHKGGIPLHCCLGTRIITFHIMHLGFELFMN